jgi:glycosyltransferase involved in cell wall biosynthesis
MESKARPSDKVSVVIPVRNAAHTLSSQLDALVSQDWPGTLVILVSDNGSCDSTPDTALSYSDLLPLRVVDASRVRGRSHAVNVGLAHCSGDFILLLDGDDVVDRGYISAMVAALKRHPIVAARLELDQLNAWRRTGSPDALQSDGLSVGMMGWLPFAFGASIGARRSVFDEIGLFDVTLPRNGDVEFSYRAQLRGLSIAFVPEAVVHYRLRSSAKVAFQQSREDGRGAVRLYAMYRSAGMPRRDPKAAARFWLGACRSCLQAWTRADFLACAHMVGFRLGLLEGSIRYKAIYL